MENGSYWNVSQHRMATVPLTRSLPLLSRLRDDGGLNYLRTSCYFRAWPAFYFSSSRSEYGMSDVPFYRETGTYPLGAIKTASSSLLRRFKGHSQHIGEGTKSPEL
jgi:hypothetical protein